MSLIIPLQTADSKIVDHIFIVAGQLISIPIWIKKPSTRICSPDAQVVGTRQNIKGGEGDSMSSAEDIMCLLRLHGPLCICCEWLRIGY
jgi:hypothetical protein